MYYPTETVRKYNAMLKLSSLALLFRSRERYKHIKNQLMAIWFDIYLFMSFVFI